MTDFRVSGEGILAGYSGSGGAVSVPVTVSKVGTAAFSDRPVSSVTLPTTTTEIRDDAFSGCASLTQMTIPTAQKFIGANAFAGTGILSQPSNPQFNGSTIEWSAPTNAPRSISSYRVYINGQQSTSATASVSLSQLTAGITNTIQIAAVDSSGEGIRSAVLEHASTGLSWAAESEISRISNVIAMSANGNRVAVADITNTAYSNVYVYDISSDGSWSSTSGAIGETLDGRVSSITMSADGSTLVVARENRIRTYTEAAGWGSIISMDDDYDYLTTPPVIALSADGQTLAVGWPHGTGSVSIFQLKGVSWSLAKKVYGSLDSSENFGCSVALSEDGTTLAVGAKYAMGTGAVRVFTGSQWSTQTNFYGEEGSSEQFGYSVSLSANGTVIAVGAPCTGTQEAVDGPMAGYGSASVWSLQSGAWARTTTFYGAAGSNDMFGTSVATNAAGTSVVVAGKSGNAQVFASNAGTWPLVASCAGTNSVAISNTGDRVICGGATAKSYSYRTENQTVIPSVCTLLGAAAVKDAATATTAAHNLLADILPLENAGITLTSGAISLFAAALPTATLQSSLAALLIAGNLIAEPQNDFKPILHALCRSTFQLAADTYIGISSEFVSAIVQSAGPTNFVSGYNPTSLYVFFPSGTSITPNTSYANVLFCLEPGVEYSFGSTTLTYRRKSELEQLLLALPNSSAFVAPAVPLFSDAATEWRRENIYAQDTLLECATYWLTQTQTAPATIATLAWLSLDMLLSSDTETQKFGEAIGAKYIPYAQGLRKIAAFSDGGADESLEYIPSGYFVGTADGSIAYPSTIQLIHTAALKRIDAAAFDAAITTVIINDKSFTAQNGNITLPYDNTRVWSINVNGPEILLPGAPTLAPTNGRLDISAAVMYIPDSYFLNAPITHVNFPTAKSTDMVEICKNAFPYGTRLIVNGVESDYHSYDTQVRLTRLSGIFYRNFGENARRVWYKSPLVTTDNVIVIPARTDEEIDITTSSLVTYDIKDESSSDMYLWTHKPALLRKTASGVNANRFQYDDTSYFYYSRTQNGTLEEGLNIGTLPGNKPTLKLLSSYVNGTLAYQRNIWRSGIINTVGKVGIPLRLDNRTLFSPFNLNQFANGQQYVIGNVSWLNNKSGNTSNPRITSILTTPTTRGNIVIEGVLSQLYPYMFGPWAKSVSAVLSAATSGKHIALTIPAFAFKNCRNMKAFDIISMGTIGESAFENCSSLEGAISVENTTSNFIINTNAFKNCSKISSLLVNNQYDVSIDTNAFKNCSSLTTIALNGERGYGYTPDISIAANAFAGCSSITDITMEGNTATVGSNAFPTTSFFFVGCSGDIAIASNAVVACSGPIMLDSSFGTVSVSSSAFGSCDGPIVIKAKSVSLSANAFVNCSGATSIIINATGAVSVGASAFAGCTGATSITINATGAVSLAANAFAGCSDLMSITINGSTVSINSSAFTGCTGCRFIIVSGLETSDPFPFATMPYLQTVQIGTGAGLVSLSTMADLEFLTSVITTGGGPLTLANNQFSGCSALQTLNIGNSLSGIGTNALTDCSSLQLLTLSFVNAADAYMNTLTTCTSLTSIQINGGARLCLFENFCAGLTSLSTINLTCGSLETPSNGNMFNGCTGLQTLRIAVGANPTSNIFKINNTLAGLLTLSLTGAIPVDSSAKFWDNNILQHITIRGTLVGSLASSLSPTVIQTLNVHHDASQNISEYKYVGYSALRDVNITPLVDISEGAFFGCTNLQTFNFGATDSIGNWAFANTGLSGEVIIPSTVTYLGDDYFLGCPNLKRVTYNCELLFFEDPTLLKEDAWYKMMYRATDADDISKYDVSGYATIQRGTDLSFNIVYAPSTGGADVTIPNNVFFKTMSWSKFASRTGHLNDMLQILTDCYNVEGSLYVNSNDNDASRLWSASFIYSLQDLAEKSAITKDVIPNFSSFAGWNGTRFADMDASANSALSTFSGLYSQYESKIYPTLANYFTTAIQDNTNLFTVDSGDATLDIDVAYRIPIANPILKLKQGDINKITSFNTLKRNGTDVNVVWPALSCPSIILDDNTVIDISDSLTCNLTTNTTSTNFASVIRWIATNLTSLTSSNNIGIKIENNFTTISDLSYKSNTLIDISCLTVSIYDSAMTNLSNTYLHIRAAGVSFGNGAFNDWSESSTLNVATYADPCVGVDLFKGSDTITVISNKFLINTPIVQLIDFSNITMADVPTIIEQHTDISANLTKNVEIGTYLPKSAKGFPKGFSYIKFQAIPSLQVYYLLQKPEDWFWAYHQGSDGRYPNGAYTDNYQGYRGDGTVNYVNLYNNDEDSIFKMTGLVNSFAPDSFEFMGYKFSRNVDKSVLRQPNTYFRAIKAVNNQEIRKSLYQASPGGRMAGTIVPAILGGALLVILAVATAGIGVAFVAAGFSAGASVALAGVAGSVLSVSTVFFSQAANTLASTGVFELGKLTPMFWVELALGILEGLIPLLGLIRIVRAGGKAIKVVSSVKPARWGIGKPFPRRDIALPKSSRWGHPRRFPDRSRVPPKLKIDSIIDDIIIDGLRYADDIPMDTDGLPTFTPPSKKLPLTEPIPVNQFISNATGTKYIDDIVEPGMAVLDKFMPAIKKIDDVVDDVVDVVVNDVVKLFPRNATRAKILQRRLKELQPLADGGELVGKDLEDFNKLVKEIEDAKTLVPANQVFDKAIIVQGTGFMRSVNEIDVKSKIMMKIVADMLQFMVFNFDSTAASMAKLLAVNTISRHSAFDQDTPIKLNEYAEYMALELLPVLATGGTNRDNCIGRQAIHEADYTDAYIRSRNMHKPPYLFPTEFKPYFNPDSQEINRPPAYHISEFYSSGTNYKHPYFMRNPNGNPCKAALTANPLLPRWEYTWTHAFFGTPTTIDNLEYNHVYPPSGAASYNDKAILTVDAYVDRELYLGNRTVEYTLSDLEAPNMVYCGANSVSIIIPDSITTIPANAFSGTNANVGVSPFSLSSVLIPPSVTSIGRRAFYRSGLPSLVYPSGVTIADYTFANTGLQQSIAMPANVQTTLYDAGNLWTTLTVASSTPMQFSWSKNVIGIQGFTTARITNGSPSGTEYTYMTNGANKLLYIKDSTQILITNLVRLPSILVDMANVTYFAITGSGASRSVVIRTSNGDGAGNYTFTNSTVINIIGSASVMTLDGITGSTIAPRARGVPGADIAAYSFMGNESLTDFEFSPYCTEIGDGAFLNCKNLRSTLNLPVGLRKIGKNAFAGTNISGIIIPHTVEVIGEGAIPDGIRIILLADAHDQVSSALPSISSQMESAEAVIVPTSAAMQNTFEVIKHAPLRLDQRPLPPINPVAQKAGDGGLLVSWNDITGAFASPAKRHSIICTAEGEDDRHIMDVKSPFRIAGLTNEKLYTIYVIAHNDVGQSPPVKVCGTPSP